MMKKIVYSICFFFIISQLITASAAELKYYTEDYPPYNYYKNGKITGIAVETLKLVWKETGEKPKKITLVPWARGYQSALEEDNAVLFSTTRIPERENMFKWACPIAEGTRFVLVGKKDKNIKVNSIEDANKYRIGAIRDDVAEQILISEGINQDILDSTSKTGLNIKKLEMGRIDLIALGEKSLFAAIENEGYDVNDYKAYYVLKEAPLCFAFNRNVDDKTVEKFQNALSMIVESDEYKRIVNEHK
ncbi:MAG: substrate-binding periplasmic protein [Desulfobacteraceae bacterium]